MRPGDAIIVIDGVAVAGMLGNGIGKRMRGVPGSVVELELSRPGVRDPIKVRLVRAALHSKTVAVQTVKPGLVRVRIAEFGGSTSADLVTSLKALDRDGGPKGLILDLRNDPGGLISAAAGVAATFLAPDAVLFSSRGRMPGTSRTVAAWIAARRAERGPSPGSRASACVNGASASAAELVAGALQDHKRAKVIGSQTFGKGSIQTVIPLTKDSAIKLTVARYFTPRGHEIQARGITPDVVVEKAFPDNAGDGVFLREADLANHLPAIKPGAVDKPKRPTAEKTSQFGTASDKALLAAVDLMTPSTTRLGGLLSGVLRAGQDLRLPAATSRSD